MPIPPYISSRSPPPPRSPPPEDLASRGSARFTSTNLPIISCCLSFIILLTASCNRNKSMSIRSFSLYTTALCVCSIYKKHTQLSLQVPGIIVSGSPQEQHCQASHLCVESNEPEPSTPVCLSIIHDDGFFDRSIRFKVLSEFCLCNCWR